MTNIPQQLQVGQTISEFPGNSWNELVAGYWRQQDQMPRRSGTGASRGLANAVSIEVKNTTGADVKIGGIMAMDGLVADSVNARRRYRIPLVKGIKYAEGKQWGVCQSRTEGVDAPTDELRKRIASLTVMGTAWCKIDVVDEEHKNANPIVDDVDKLQSTDDDEAVSIIWKEGGTGEKWGLVLLGGGGKAKASLIGAMAIVKGTVPASSDIDLNNLDPDVPMVTLGELAPEYGPGGDSFDSGALIIDPVTGAPIFEPGDLDDPGSFPIPMVLTAVNPSFTDFIGEHNGVIVSGSIANLDAGEAEKLDRKFLVTSFDNRSLPNFNGQTGGFGKTQIVYHEAGARDFRLDAEPCPPPP